MVSVLLEYIDLRNSLIFLTKQFLLCWHYTLDTYYAQNYAGIIGQSLLEGN